MKTVRSSGVLLHITSLPGRFGIGDLGPEAYHFADFLARCDQQLWQVLPLVPVGYGYSPYAGLSTFAGNALLISPDLLVVDGLLDQAALADPPSFPSREVDFEQAQDYKYHLLRLAYDRFVGGQTALDPDGFAAFCRQEAYWLDDYALFMTLKHAHGGVAWTSWPAELAQRQPAAMAEARATHAEGIEMHKFWQFLFTNQWNALRAYCHKKGINIFGDLPIYVAHDSADVWAHPDLFHLDAAGNPTVVAGVPPDYFSETGQRWGNPIYRWEVMKSTGYQWWTQRFSKILEQVDLVRLDHFRGFEAYWEVPAEEKTAIRGRWVDGPGADLFRALEGRLGTLPVIAENLGVITEGVTALMELFDFPGMAILQFAFDSDASNEFLPHNLRPHLVAYTGTHDNDTVVGWWRNPNSTQDEAAAQRARAYCRQYLGFEDDERVNWAFIRALFGSVANTAIIPLQDLMGLGSEARVNTPGEGTGNWTWRYTPDQLTLGLPERLQRLTHLFGRAPQPKDGLPKDGQPAG
jgi:4-alpha-glucanotransferase